MRIPCAERGITTIESVVVLSLLAIVLLGVTGLHMLAVSAGDAAEASSIAANLARARLETLLALPRSEILAQNETEVVEQVAAGKGRAYTIRTTVDGADPARLDITVSVTWGAASGRGCAAQEPGAGCTGWVSRTRTLKTRLYTPDTL